MGTVVIERIVLHRLIADGTSGIVPYQRRYNELGLTHRGQREGVLVAGAGERSDGVEVERPVGRLFEVGADEVPVVADRGGHGAPGVGHPLTARVRLHGGEGQFEAGGVGVAEGDGLVAGRGARGGDVRAAAQGVGDPDGVVIGVEQRAFVAVDGREQKLRSCYRRRRMSWRRGWVEARWLSPIRHPACHTCPFGRLSHPLRLNVLTLLRERGPSTATRVADELGINPGAASYHLRRLASGGLIVEEPDRGTGRERWWKSAHRQSIHDPAAAPPEQQEAGRAYTHAVALAAADRLRMRCRCSLRSGSTSPPTATSFCT